MPRTESYKQCRIIGKTIEDWDDASNEMAILQPHLQNFDKSDQTTAPTSTSNIETQSLPNRKAVMPLNGKNPVVSADENFIGVSPGFQIAFNKIRKVAKTDATVLFLGDSGCRQRDFCQETA